MNWNSILGLLSSIALFLPVFFILVLRLGVYRTFPALLIYYSSVFIYNLFTLGYINAGEHLTRYWGITNNLLDTPLMLIFLTYFSTSASFTRKIKIVIAIFLAFEAAILTWKGITIDAITIIMAPGLLLIFSLSLFFFVRQTKIAIMHRKGTGKAIIAAALLFAYGCFALIYLMYYVFKPEKPDPSLVRDVFLIFFVVTIVSSLLMSLGIIVERKRIQKLSELKTTRKELAVIYKDTKVTAPLKTATLDFDKEQWN
jgi:hypothetical protein